LDGSFSPGTACAELGLGFPVAGTIGEAMFADVGRDSNTAAADVTVELRDVALDMSPPISVI